MGILFACFLAGASAARAESSPELFFPVDKSEVQILPQRFEYQLVNKDQFRIGNVTMDAKDIDFQIIPLNASKSRYKLQFRWPAGLLNRGEIAIKDNSGKGIWFQKFQPDQVQISPDRTTASYETEAEVPTLLRMVQLYPFFRFCVHREEPLTKTYLCSKDLYLRKSKGHIVIVQRDSYRPQSFVEINGQAVGDQGLIFLNSPSEFISLRALLLSGATLEVDTRMKKTNFKDVYLSEDEKQLIIRAQGAEPIDPSTVERPPGEDPDVWQTRLDVERPYTYLKGEGDLPLRQEFLIQGKVRKENVKVKVLQGDADLTFKEEHTLILKPAKGLKISSADKKARVERIGSDEYRWTLLELRKNELNRRYIKVSSGQDDYFAAYDIRRQTALDASLRLMLPLWAQANLLYTPHLNWGFSAQYDQQLTRLTQSNLKDPEVNLVTVGAQYRFPGGVHLNDAASVAELFVQAFQVDSQSLLLYGLGYQGEFKSPQTWAPLFPWTFVRFRLPVATTNSKYQLKFSYDLEVSLRSLTSSTSYWEVGLRNQQYTLGNEAGDATSKRTLGFIGKGWIF